MSHYSRRQLLRLAVSLPLGASFDSLRARTETHAGKIKITAIQAMALRNIAGNCLIRVDTDAGLSGYGEAGASGPIARARIETMKDMLIGKDPLAIEVHYQNMSSLMHNYMAHIPTVSGIDIALWDLAGKIMNVPVSTLLGGRFRDDMLLYSHGVLLKNALDPASCRDWASAIRQQPEGFTAFKVDIHPILGVPPGKFASTLDTTQLRNVRRAYQNLRDAVGDDMDLAVHCHSELDTPSAIGVTKAVEPMNPLFVEDALNPPFSQAWMALRSSTRLTLLTGEKLETTREFKPFLDTQAVDIVHPDLSFAGGISGTRKIADYAALTRTPVALHNVGSLLLTYANAHFSSSIQNFYRSESALGRPIRYIEQMAARNPPSVRHSRLSIPDGPGLGLELNEEFLRRNLAPGEPYWS